MPGRWVGILSVANLFSFLDRTILGLLSQPIKLDLGLSDTELGLLQGAAFSVFYTLMIIPFGWVTDRGNRIRMVSAGMVLWSLATAASGLADGFWPLFAARICVGIGEATLAASGASLISDHFPNDRRTMPLSVYTLIASAGVGVGLVGGGALADWLAAGGAISVPGFGPLAAWQVIFIAIGLPGVAWAFVLLVTPEPVRRETADETVTWRELIDFLRLRRDIIGPHFVGYCFYTMFAYGAGGWLPTFFVRVHGWTLGEVGWRYGIPYLIFPIVGGVLAGWIVRRLQQRGRVDANLITVAGSNALVVIPGLAAPLVSNEWLSLVLVMPLIALWVFSSGPSLAAIQEISPNRLRGRMTAIYYAVTNLIGLSFGGLIIGLLNDYVFTGTKGIANSIALAALVMCPTGAWIVSRGGAARRQLG
ncbi:MAG: MFS transporter [Alphaproteobacteria bacterium]|nr:MFS transporter [Alphaproteobacteria bacterium]